jgi:hypothetical protein
MEKSTIINNCSIIHFAHKKNIKSSIMEIYKRREGGKEPEPQIKRN